MTDVIPVPCRITRACSDSHCRSHLLVRIVHSMRSETMTVDAPSHSLTNLFTPLELQRIARGHVLFEEGQQPAGVYILHSGEVELSTVLDGRKTRVRTARAGEILGLMAVISGGTHLSSAVAVSPCEVGFIEAEELQKLIDESPAVWFSILRQLSQDVNASYDVIRERLDRGHC
jgi:CRP-like cAMP-binding protein